MADFKMAMILLAVLCLVSNSLGMSLTGKDENSAVARFFQGLDKSTVIVIVQQIFRKYIYF